jgi:hypothetical protein
MNVVSFENGTALQDGMVIVYNADPLTGEFVGVTQEYIAAGVGLPALSCLVAPPDAERGFVARLLADGSGWELVTDNRGQTAYRKATREAVSVRDIGPLDDALTLDAPATAYDVWQGSGWVTDTVAQKAAQENEAEALRAAKIQEVNTTTQLWQTQLALGMISDANKAKLIKWMTYADQLQAVDVTLAPYVVWPEKPQ